MRNKYVLIKNYDDEMNISVLVNSNKNNKRKKEKKINVKNKILKKYFNDNLSILKCFIIFISLYFLIIIFIEFSFKIDVAIFNNIKKIVFNSTNYTSIFDNYNSNNITNPVNNSNDIYNNKNISKNDNNKNIKTDKIDEQTDIKKAEQTDNKKIEKTDIKKEEKTDIKKEEEKYVDVEYDNRDTSYRKASNFIDKCLKNQLIQDKTKFNQISLEKPKVSAVIPVYNSKNSISRCIRSIQNQDLLNLEIILVNDFSTDDTLKYIQTYQKEDPRIKIINNKKNMGILYSRSIGALSAKGDYIFPIDNDDLFLDKDVFSIISNVAIKGKFDIVEFKGINTFQYGSSISRNIKDIGYSNHKKNLALKQPELGDYPIKSTDKLGNYNLIDVYLWNKCISTKIYQKALNRLGEERYSRFMLAHEDVLIIFALFNTAESFKFIGKYGIYHISHEGSAFWLTKPLEHDLKEFYLMDAIINFSQSTDTHRKLIPNIIIGVLRLKYLQNIVQMNNYGELLKSILDKVLKSNLYSESLKNEIRKAGKNLKFLNYPF